MKNFDPKKFQGIWYELEVPVFSDGSMTKCAYNRVTLTDKNIFHITYVTYDILFGINSSASFFVTVKNSEMPQPDDARSDIMLDTDYDNYGIFYHCGTLGLMSDVNVRVMGRNRMLDHATQQAVDAILFKNYVFGSTVKTNQNDCPALND